MGEAGFQLDCGQYTRVAVMPVFQARYSSIVAGFLVLVFPFSVIIDSINGWMITNDKISGISVGQLFRAGIISACVVLIANSKKLHKRSALVCFSFFLLSCVTTHQAITRSTESTRISLEIRYLIDALYPYIILAALFSIHRKNKNLQDWGSEAIIYWGLFASSSIIVLYFLGLGFPVYAGAFGSKGFFKAQNDIGLGLLLALTICLFHAGATANLKRYTICIVISAGALMLMSRAALIGVPAIWTISFSIMFLSKRKLFRKACNIFMLSIVSGLLITGGTITYRFISENKYLLEKFTSASILNPRDDLFKSAIYDVAHRDGIDLFIGKGATEFMAVIGTKVGDFDDSKEVEVDYLDILGRSGLIGFAILFYMPLFSLYYALKQFMRSKSMQTASNALQLIILLGYSSVVGHTLLSALAAPLYALLLFENSPESQTKQHLSPRVQITKQELHQYTDNKICTT